MKAAVVKFAKRIEFPGSPVKKGWPPRRVTLVFPEEFGECSSLTGAFETPSTTMSYTRFLFFTFPSNKLVIRDAE
jgi:hypothetical protein